MTTTSGGWSKRSRSTEQADLTSSSHWTVEAPGRDPLEASPGLQSFRIFGRIQDNYRDVLDVHLTSTTDDFVRQQKLISPSVLDGAVLHTMRATKDSYLGIKWHAEHAFGVKRDVCFVEMVGYTVEQDVQRWRLSPWRPSMSPSVYPFAKFTRVRMKRTMLVLPVPDAPLATSEVFVMGTSEATESSLATLAQHRLTMAVLSDLSLVIDSKKIAQMRLVHE
ncbi:hypothetical protein PsorP6_005823 [Peronosclerospora sorghi]|uniref:Uncharacterized protein n=1 Tax=Peronosclerospora sorghi TaxID=230839 RepID=A0ACC0W3R6_9STRA|nr:hypothetical protein PsorP6_005823 [Peronosclerospora sorghi]